MLKSSIFKALLPVALVVCGSLISSGCVVRAVGATVSGTIVGEVSVSSFVRAESDISSAPYCLFPADAAMSEGDLMFAGLKRKTKLVLGRKGLTESKGLRDCGQAVFIGAGYGAPQLSV